MRNAPSLKKIKRIPLITFILLSFYFLFTLYMCYENIGSSISIEAKLVNSEKHIQTNVGKIGNLFTSGIEGRLNWKVENFSEGILVNLANTNEMFSIYDLLYMFVINLVLFITVKRMTEETIYSNQTINGFKMILYLIVLAPLYGFFTNMISAHILKDLTNNQVTSPLKAFGAFKVWIGIFFIQIIPLIFKKGKSLQKEQELTI